MNSLRYALPALGLGLTLASAGAYADTTTATAPAATTNSSPGQHWGGGHRHGRGGFAHVLKKLNLTPEQQTQVKAIFAQAKPQFRSLHDSSRQNREALAVTAPTDPKYPALLATQKANAATAIQQGSDIKAQIYAVLSPGQVQQIPAIIAADKAAREARMAAWRGKHAQS